MKRFITALNIALSLIAVLMPMESQAINNYDKVPSINDTIWYDPRDYTSATCATGSSGPLVGADNAAKIFNFLIGKGLKDFQAVGIMANLMAESGLDPAIAQGGGKATTPMNGVGFGIAQWTFTSRQAPLVALAAKENLPVNTLAPQLDYLWVELTGGYSSSVLTPLKAATTYEQAVQIVMIHFESPADQSQSAIQGRINGGRPLLAKFAGSGGAGAGGGSPGASGSCGSVGGASASNIVQIALAELGTNEGPAGANGGGSCKYQGTACPQEWCADFVSWVFKTAGAPFTGGADGGWRIAGAAAVGDWFKANGVWIANPGHPVPITDPSAPKPGDVVVYGGSGHTNIVVSYDGTTVVTVGGNESNAVSKYPEDVFGTAVGWGRLK